MRNKPDPVDAYVGGRPRDRRALLGLSQGEIGARLGLGFQQIQKCERGTNRIGASRLYRLSKILGVPVGYFFEDMPMEVVAASKHRAVVIADDAVPTPREVRMLVRAYSCLPAAPLRRHIVDLIKAVAWVWRLGKCAIGARSIGVYAPCPIMPKRTDRPSTRNRPTRFSTPSRRPGCSS